MEFLVAGSPVGTLGSFAGSLHQRVDLAAEAGADLELTKDNGVTDVAPGDTLTYTLTVRNIDDTGGGKNAFGIVLSDPLPVGASFVSASDGGSETAGEVRWPAFDLAAGATVTRTLVLRVDDTFPAGTVEIRNAASVTSDGSDGIDPVSSNNTGIDTDVLAGGPDLELQKTADLTAVAPGQEVIYTLSLTNTGFQDATGIQLSDTLPADVLFQTASDDGREVNGVVTWPAFDLALGATVTRTVRVKLPDNGGSTAAQLVNSAAAIAEVADVDPPDNNASHVLTVTQQSDLEVPLVDAGTALIDAQTLVIGGSVSVTVDNTGNADVAAPFFTSVFEDLDADGTYTPGVDNTLGSLEFSAGLPAGSDTVISVPVTGTVQFRNNLLFAMVDSTEVLPELDETNNVEKSARDCQAIPTPEDFAPAVEVSWPVSSTDKRFSADVLATPIVVQLNDDNGDGRRDERDIPDIVFNSIDLTFPLNPTPRLRAIRGDTGETLWDAFPPVSQGFLFALTGMAAGDIDGDGRPEIIASIFDGPSGKPNALAAYEHNGALKWVSSRYSTHPDGTTLTNRDNPLIAHLDGDGNPEIVVGANVFNANGSLRWSGTGGQGYQSARNADSFDSGAISIVADLDLDGSPEVVTGNTAYRADGSIYWQIPMDDGYTAVANFDADDFPEIVVVSRGVLRLHEHDGTLILGPVDLPGAGAEAGGAPTVANFDDDPEPEIGVAGSTQYAVFESDGSIKWQSATQDGSSNMTGSTVFDLDGNGRFEVIYRDEAALRIYRGEDGFVLYELPLSSITFNEQPVVADVDRDGNAEIVVSSDVAEGVSVPDRTRGIRIIGDTKDNWVAARAIWNQHQYNINNVNDDGSIPRQPTPSWLDHNTYRANVAPAAGAFAAPDLSASRLTVDLGSWPTVTATARVGNGGTTFAPSGVPVSFYDGDPAAGGQLLGTVQTSGDLEAGQFEDVSVSFEGVGFGDMTLFVVADDDGTGEGRQTECDETNNQHSRIYDTNDVGLLLTSFGGTEAVQPGETYTITLTAANGSNFTRSGIDLSTQIPAFTTVIAISDGGSLDTGTVSWPLFDLTAGSSAPRTVTLQVAADIPLAVTQLSQTSTVTDDGTTGGDPTPDNNTVVDINAVLTVRADAGGPYAGNEGADITFDASASSDRDGTVVGYEWDLDLDGEFDDGTGVNATWAFDDNGTFTIAVRVTDDSGEQDVDTAEVVVGNLPPVVEAGPDVTLTEGDAATLTATSFTDPGTGDSHSATIDWGDGTAIDTGVVNGATRTVAGGHDYPDDGIFTVNVCVTDDDGDTGCDSFQLTVENSDPVVVEEGDIDLNNWVAEHLRGAANWSVAADGQTVNQTVNTDPSVFYGPFTAIGVAVEGQIRVGTSGDDDYIGFVLGFQPGDFSNPNADYLLVDWKQGTQNAFGANGFRGLAVSRVRGIPALGELWGHLDVSSNGSGNRVEELQRGINLSSTGWSDFATYTFTFITSPNRVQVLVNGVLEIDVAGDFNFGSGRLGFYNFSQGSVRYSAFSNQGLSSFEGEILDFEAAFNDLGILDTHTATIDWQDGTVDAGTVVESDGSGRVTGSHLYLDNLDPSIEVCVTDDEGGVGCGSFAATVRNVPPVVAAGEDRLAYAGEGLAVNATFTDPGVLDTHTAIVDWGDGSSDAGIVTEADGSGTVAASHEYVDPGIYDVEVCVTDKDGGSHCDSFQVTWLVPVLDLRIDKRSATQVVRPDQAMIYEILAINEGTREPLNVVVTDVLPEHFDFVSADQGGVYDAASRTVTWTFPRLDYQETRRLLLEVQAQNVLPFDTLSTNTAEIDDDGTYGPDLDPADNSDSAVVRLWDAFTPFVVARPPINLSTTSGVFATASSEGNLQQVASRVIDGNPSTSWFTNCGDSANQGGTPFIEVQLNRPATVRELRVLGNHQAANGHDIFRGFFELFDAEGQSLFQSVELDLPGPTRDFALPIPETEGVRRARFTSVADESCNPGLAELEVIGFYGDATGDTQPEGSTLVLDSLFFDTETSETHTATINWGDGVVEPGTVVENAGSGRVDGSHLYPEDSVQTVEVCVTDQAGNTGCDSFQLTVTNVAPNVNDNGDIDLRTWITNHYDHITGQGRARWDVAADGRSVLQVINSRPSIFYGDFFAFGTRITGKIRVETTSDDDFIGFALGYQPDDVTAANPNFLLLDWKQRDQDRGRDGMAISRITGPTPDNWGHNTSASMEEIARAINLGSTGWADRREYKFTFEFRADKLRVWVDDVLEFDLDGEFADGRLAFYNYSQSTVRYSAFQFEGLVINEGEIANLQATFNDPGLLDTHTAEVDWMDGSTSAGTVTMSGQTGFVDADHLYLDNRPAEEPYMTELCVTDDDGGVGCGTFPITVRNLPPVIDAGPDGTGFAESPFNFNQAVFSDPGILDTHTTTVDWGDGSQSDGTTGDLTLDETDGAGTITGSHTYALAGSYTVEVCVTDKDGASDCDTFIAVISEPLLPPDLTLTKVDTLVIEVNDDGVANPTETLEYTLVVTNIGAGPATGVTLDDVIPVHTSVVAGSVSSSQGSVLSEDPVRVQLGQIEAGASASVSFRVLVDTELPPDTEQIVNQATVTSAELADLMSDDPDTAEAGDPTITPVIADDTVVCIDETFDQDLDDTWNSAFIGDADQGTFEVVNGALRVSGNGSELYHGDDNGHFVYRDVEGDFRTELAFTDLPGDTGGQYRKACLTVRDGLDPLAARFMACLIPHFPNQNDPGGEVMALQFDHRPVAGEAAIELASTRQDVGLPTHAAFTRRGDVFTVSFSNDGGATWVEPLGGVGGSAQVVLPSTLQVGVMVASYDPAQTFTVEVDDLSICSPNIGDPGDPGDPGTCEVDQKYDVVYLFDLSESMTADFADGSGNKLQAAREALRLVHDQLEVRQDGSRAALLTFAGGNEIEGNLNGSLSIRENLSVNLGAVTQGILDLDSSDVAPLATTPTALGLRGLREQVAPLFDSENQPVVVLVTDGVPNIDIDGRGPDEYRFDEIQGLSLRDAGGNFLSWGQAAWLGHWNAAIRTFDGETMANSMLELERLKAQVPELLIYGISIHGNGLELGTFSDDLVDYAAYISGGRSYQGADLASLEAAASSLLADLFCDASPVGAVGDRVWNDLDGDGEQDAFEPGLSQVALELLDADGNATATVTTNSQGTYLFENVAPGSHTVRVDPSTLPGGLDQATFDADGNATPNVAGLMLDPWQVTRELDFGYRATPAFQDQPPATTSCPMDDFEDGIVAGGDSPYPWSVAAIGDASSGGAAEVAGRLELSSNGSSMWTDDNIHFMYHPVSGDFRLEVDVVDVPVDPGGNRFRKAGAMILKDLDVRSPRVMVQYLPDPQETGPLVQFGFRETTGGPSLVLSDPVRNVQLPIRLALEKRGNLYSAWYSTDGGDTWQQNTAGGAGSSVDGSVELDLGEQPLVGLAAASYSNADQLTVAFDDLAVCSPADVAAAEPAVPGVCDDQVPMDVAAVLDLSGSMAADYSGGPSRFEAARLALYDLRDRLAARGDGSRLALVTYASHPDSGADDSGADPESAVRVLSGLTSDLGSVSAVLDDLRPEDIDPAAAGASPLALQQLEQLLATGANPAHRPMVVWLSDEQPNVDLLGRGPYSPELPAVDQTPPSFQLTDDTGAYLPWSQVAWQGAFLGDFGRFAGEPVANAMSQLEALRTSVPGVRVFSLALRSDGTVSAPFDEALLGYAAWLTNGEVDGADNTQDLLLAGGSLWHAMTCVESP